MATKYKPVRLGVKYDPCTIVVEAFRSDDIHEAKIHFRFELKAKENSPSMQIDLEKYTNALLQRLEKKLVDVDAMRKDQTLKKALEKVESYHRRAHEAIAQDQDLDDSDDKTLNLVEKEKSNAFEANQVRSDDEEYKCDVPLEFETPDDADDDASENSWDF